jgi:hypothetical protein
MQRVPQEGDICTVKGLQFRISRMKGPKIEEVIVSPKEMSGLPGKEVPGQVKARASQQHTP